MQAPIFVLDREGWLSVFASVAATGSGLEVNDVETGEYVAVDAAGRPLVLTVVEPARRANPFTGPGPSVQVREGSGEPLPDLLRRVLAEAVGDDGDADLDALVARAQAARDAQVRRLLGEARASFS